MEVIRRIVKHLEIGAVCMIANRAHEASGSRYFGARWLRRRLMGSAAASGRNHCLVAVDDQRIGSPVGYVLYRLESDGDKYHKSGSRSIEIVDIAVTPERQRRGIGTSLLHGILEHHSLLLEGLGLYLPERNEVARKFFVARGFLATGFVREWDDSGDGAIRFDMLVWSDKTDKPDKPRNWRRAAGG